MVKEIVGQTIYGLSQKKKEKLSLKPENRAKGKVHLYLHKKKEVLTTNELDSLQCFLSLQVIFVNPFL